MSRYQAIVKELKAINGSVFQELCDKFLVLRNRTYAAFSRTGSQEEKQKTIKGTPDSFFLLPNGNFLFVETTTNTSDRNKLSNDIKACFDPEKSKVPIAKIEEIILCFNWNIDQAQVNELNGLVQGYKNNVIVTYYSLDFLAIELHLHHRDLVHEYLGLPLDTGQIVSIDSFIDEYNRKAENGISTPLDNTFIHREDERKTLKKAITETDFVILTGAPGVGKTRLALEVIKNFLKENESFEAYCISYKNHVLLDDLYQYLNTEKDYILFVDDANRIDSFNQITGFYNSVRVGSLKVAVTVRDYALQEIGILCQEYNPQRIDIEKLSDNHITDIIKSVPYEILNQAYQREILRIADGNPRVAIMASLLAIDKQDISVLHDVSDLFEKYFGTFVKDKGEFNSELNIKCLGIISFFFAIPYKNKELVVPILSSFDMDYGTFVDTADNLDKLEIVEIQYEYVKIPEQNLATFFFYRSFVKDRLLSFQTLLNQHFKENKDRFRDCVIPANNTFGYENVMKPLKPDLKAYWTSVGSDPDEAYNFLSIFWFYLQAETLDFLFNEISSLPNVAESAEYNIEYNTNDFAYNQNRTIELLGQFLRSPQHLNDAIQLAIEFASRKPEHLPELIHKYRSVLTFDKSDARNRYHRQTILFDILIEGLENGKLIHKILFYELSKTFMSYAFEHTEPGRKMSIVWYQYQLPNSEAIHKFRKRNWETIYNNFNKYPNESFNLLCSYGSCSLVTNKDIMEFDLPFLIDIINSHLSPDSFPHCKYVQEQIRWFERNSISAELFDQLKQKFTNKVYQTYLKVNWNYIADNEIYEDINHREYEELKKAEIRSSFLFNNIAEIESFYDTFLYLKRNVKDNWSFNNSLDTIIDENAIKHFDLSLEILYLIIQKGNEIHYQPGLVFSNHLSSQDKSEKIWNLIQSSSFTGKANWVLTYFGRLDNSLIDEKHSQQIIQSFGNINEPLTIFVKGLEKYLTTDPELFQKILKEVVDKNQYDQVKVYIWPDLFKDYFDKLGNDKELIEKAYLQQYLIQDHYDLYGEGFLKLLEASPDFLVKFVETLYSLEGVRLSGSDLKLGFVWKVKDIESQIDQVIDLCLQKEQWFGIGDHFVNVFFKNLQGQDKERAGKYILEYIRKNYDDTFKINVMMDIVRRSMNALFEDALLLYVSLNQDVENFDKIRWRGSGGAYFGDIIIADREAAEWRKILSILENSNMGIQILPIKSYLNDRIEGCLRSADLERQNKFLRQDF